MTVHKAKGLEFPVVDPRRHDREASQRPRRPADRSGAERLLPAARALDADRAGDPRGARDRARRSGRRPRRLRRGDARAGSAGRPGGRRRDVGRRLDEPAQRCRLSRACRAPRRRRQRRDVRQFKKDSVWRRPDNEPSNSATVCPGEHVFGGGEPYPVVWWDPHALDLGVEPAIGIRRESLIVKDVPDAVVAEGLREYEQWRTLREEAIAKGSMASLNVRTATEWASADAVGRRFDRRGVQRAARVGAARAVRRGTGEPRRGAAARAGIRFR